MNENREWNGNEHIRRLMQVDRSSLPPDGRPHFNRLIFERSPYLLQHAENPVNWYAWSDAAFAAAQAEDKPILLSIGYATCHWCHVMENESFEDTEVAEVLNRDFIAIKVDREERPDIDEQYMLVAQMMTGSGGWPLNVVMTPDRRPFFTATYLPKRRRGGMPGLIEFLENVAKLWKLRRDLVEENCASVMDGLAKVAQTSRGDLPGDEVAQGAVQVLAQIYDGQQGGFGSAPKFPMPVYLQFLVRQGSRTTERLPFAMVEQTLGIMRDGGIYDQVGDGFHRYAVDRLWIVPHFEKMLYDQALLALAYIDFGQATGDPAYHGVAADVLRFVIRDLKAPGGGFYSALDADSEGEEGKFYVWTTDELKGVLGEEDGMLFARIFSASETGNFEGSNILHVDRKELEKVQQEVGAEALAEKLRRGRELLFAERRKRIHPLRDEKILVSWNGLAIAAAARAYATEGNAVFLLAAREAAEFIERHLVTGEGRLLRSYLGTAAPVSGFLEDYAFYVKGLIELHQATLEETWIDRAVLLARKMLELFVDAAEGGLFDTPADGEAGLVRMKSVHDGVMPSGNAIAAENLLRLGRITGDDAFVAAGENVIRAFMGSVEKQPVNHLQMVAAGELAANEQVLTLKGKRGEVEPFRRVSVRRFLPDLVLRFQESSEPAVAQLCAAGRCGLPLHNPEDLEKELASL